MIEEISKYVHEEMWVKWAQTILETEPNISIERRERWEECFIPYEELSEEMKDLDRQFARKIYEIVNPVKNIESNNDFIIEISSKTNYDGL